MPKPRYEKTTYDDRARKPVVEDVPHVPVPPPSPFCIKESVKEYRDGVRPDWWQKVTEDEDKLQRLKRGQSSYAADSEGCDGPSGSKKVKSKSKFQNHRAQSCNVRSCSAQGRGGETYKPQNYTPRTCSLPHTRQPPICNPRSWKSQKHGVQGYGAQICGCQTYKARSCEALKLQAEFFGDSHRRRSCYYRQYSCDEGTCQSFVPLMHTMQSLQTLKVPQLFRCR
ncbi:unnamed protein product [Ixodes hexagonus]